MNIKHLRKIPTVSSCGALNTGWVQKFCDFRPVSRYISQTIQDSATVSDTVWYAVNFATELVCLRDSSYVLTNDVVFSNDELNDLLSTAFCTQFRFCT